MLSMPLKRLLCLLSLLFLVSGCGIFKKPEPTIAPFISSTVVVVPIEPDDLKYVECPFEGSEEPTTGHVHTLRQADGAGGLAAAQWYKNPAGSCHREDRKLGS